MSLQHAGHLRFATALDERSSHLERVQENGQAGPCVDALRSGKAVAVADLEEAEHGWGAYGQAAREAGIAAVTGIPMLLNGEKIGTLNVYSNARRDWSEDDLDAARVLADIATSYIINASKLAKQRRINEQLQEALASRIVIEQAKGVLAAERGISIDEAFQRLRRHARATAPCARSPRPRILACALELLGCQQGRFARCRAAGGSVRFLPPGVPGASARPGPWRGILTRTQVRPTQA